jgi:hypothetical protein
MRVRWCRGAWRSRHLVALKLLSEREAQGQQGLAEALSLDPSNVAVRSAPGLVMSAVQRSCLSTRGSAACDGAVEADDHLSTISQWQLAVR